MRGAGDGSGHGEQAIGNPTVPTQTPAERGWTQGKAGDVSWRDGSGSGGGQEATTFSGTSLAAQWLRLCVSNAGGMGSIPGRGTKIPYTLCHSQKKRNRETMIFSWSLSQGCPGPREGCCWINLRAPCSPSPHPLLASTQRATCDVPCYQMDFFEQDSLFKHSF